MADPFDDYLNRMIDPAGVAALRQQRAPAVPPLSPQEEEGVLAHAGRGVLGGVAYAGQMIDKTLGGRAVRGLLAGNPRELLSVLPGSDVVGVTDPDQAVSGEQLLKKAGLLEGDGEKGTFELRDLAGPAAEALLSPATYLTLGTGAALTEAGQAARASGTLAGSMAGRIAAGQSGLAGIGLPFARPAAVLGTGPTAQKFAGWLGAKGEGLLYSKAGRAASALFDPAVRDTLSEPAQRASRAASATLPGLEGGALTRLAGLQRDADAAGLLNSPLLRGAVEGTQYGPYADPALDAGVSHVGQGVRSFLRDLKGAENDLGVPTPQLSDPTVGYAPRSMTPLPGRQASGARAAAQPLSPWHQALTPREEILKGVQGGTGAVNEILKDPALRRMPAGDAAKYLLGEAAGPMADPLADAAVLSGAARHVVGDPAQAARLADFARSLPPDYAEKGLDFFGNNLFTDLRRRAVSSARSRSLAEGLHDALSKAAGPLAQAGMDGDSVAAVLKRVGLTDPAAELVQIENLQRLGKIDPSLDLAGATEALAGLHVPRQVASDLTRSVQGYARPEALAPALNLWDSFTNLFKAGVTSVWPAKYTRDFAQGVFQNLAHGNYDPALGAGPKGFLAPYQYAKALLRDGGTLPPGVTARIPGYAGLAPAEAAAKLADEMFAFKVTGPERAGMAVENVGRHAAEKALTLPGSAQPGLLDIAREGAAGLRSGFTDPATGKVSLKAFREGAANPLGIAGVGGRPATTFAPAAAGGQLMEYNDDLQRGAAFIAKRLQGYAPEQAAAAVKAAHYDMGNLTGFEKAVGKRAVPFYCVPVDHEILTQGGWKTYDQLAVGEPVLSCNHQTGELSWEPLEAVNVFDYDGDLMTLERKGGVKYLFTEDHRWPVEVSKSFVKGKWYGGERLIVPAREMNHRHMIPLTGEYSQAESLLTPRQAAILGWAVTDGYHRHRGRHTEMLVYQSPKKYLSEVIGLLGTTPRKPHPQTGVVAVPVAIGDVKELTPHFRSKEDLPGIAARLSREAAEAMYQAMLMAEGSASKKSSFVHFSQKQGPAGKAVTDAFLILCVLTGRAANASARGCYVRFSKFIQPFASGSKPMGREHYKGKIWCPTTKHGTWVMRHGGGVIITGNSWMKQNMPAVATDIATRPSGLTAQSVRLASGMRNDEGFMPEHLREGLALPVGPGDNGTQRFLSHLGLNFEDLDLFGVQPTAAQTVARTAQHALGVANPLIKAPLEVATDRQFYSGRDLSDLHGAPTGNVLVDQAVMNSPLARLLTTARTLADERKGLGAKLVNTLGPAKVTDVDMAKAKDVAAREYATELLKQNPAVRRYEETYVPAGKLNQLSPAELTLYRLYKMTETRAREKGKAARGR